MADANTNTNSNSPFDMTGNDNSINRSKEDTMEDNNRLFLRKEARVEQFISKLAKVKDKLESLGFVVGIRATDGDIRLITTGEGKLISTNVVFPAIETELFFDGDYAFEISFKYNQKAEKKIVGMLNALFGKENWAYRNQDESKVTITYIKGNDGWRGLEVFATSEDPKGYKRAKNLWHTSPTFQHYADVIVLREGEGMPKERAEDTLYIKLFTGGPEGKHDGHVFLNATALSEMNGDTEAFVYDTFRVSFNTTDSMHIKGDAVVLDMGLDSPDIVAHTDNLKIDEFGFKDGVNGALVMGNPKKQYKTARTSPQFDASFGTLMQQPHREIEGYNYYEVAAEESLGRRIAETVLGKNNWIGFDISEEDKDAPGAQVMEYQNAAEAVCDTMGSIIGVPSLMIKSLGMLDSQMGLNPKRGGKDLRVRIPGASMMSMRSTDALEAAGLPVPTGNTISLSRWGSHIPDEIQEAVRESTGGSDWDDTWTLILVRPTKDFSFHGYQFKAGQIVGLWFRFPMGARIHMGKVGVEFWISNIANDEVTRHYINRVMPKYGRKVMLLDPEILPPHVLELPEPTNTEPTTGTLSFIDQVTQSIEMQGTYDKVANAVTLIVHLASMNGWKLNSKFTLDFSAEFLIDVCTKTFGDKDLAAIEALVSDLNTLILSEVKHLGEAGRMFTRRTGRPSLHAPEVSTWLFDLQVDSYMKHINPAKAILAAFERDYRNAWKTMSPSGNIHQASNTPSKIANRLVARLKEIKNELLEEAGRKHISAEDYLPMYTKMAKELANNEDLENHHIMELFMMQGNTSAWSQTKETNLIGHVLFNSAMLGRTLQALTNSDNSWMDELLDQGIYNDLMSRLDSTVPMHQEIIRVFLEVVFDRVLNSSITEEHRNYVVDRFTGSIAVEDIEKVSEAIKPDEEPMSVAELADQLAEASVIWDNVE